MSATGPHPVPAPHLDAGRSGGEVDSVVLGPRDEQSGGGAGRSRYVAGTGRGARLTRIFGLSTGIPSFPSGEERAVAECIVKGKALLGEALWKPFLLPYVLLPIALPPTSPPHYSEIE